MSNVSEQLKRFDKLESEKATYLSLWQEIGEFVYPSQQDFTRYLSTGHKRRRIIFDNTGERALDIFASSMLGLLANPATKWVNFQHPNPDINDTDEVQRFIDEAQLKVLAVLNDPRVKFYENLFTALKMTGAFGVAPIVMDIDENGLRVKAESPKGYNFTEDFSGNVEEHFFEKKFKVGTLKKKGWNIPSEYELKDDETEVAVVRHLFDNPNYNPDKAINANGLRNKKYYKYKGAYYLKSDKTLLHEDYFSTKRIATARWDRIAGEKWSDSPARVALGDIKVVNAYERAAMVAIEKQINPPMIIASEAKFGRLDTSAGAVNVARGGVAGSYDLMTVNGNLAQPYEWAEFKKQQIRSAFYVDVFQTAETPNMTATEAAIRNQEKLRGIGPKVAKLQADLIEPIVATVLEMLVEQGKLKVPDAILESNDNINVVYLSPIAQAQRATEATSILQFVQDVSVIAQIDPAVIDTLDTDGIANLMADIRGVPEKALKPSDDVEAIREQRAKTQQAQQMLEGLQSAAQTGKTISEAEQIRQ